MCQAFDQYALFNLQKFNGLGKGDASMSYRYKEIKAGAAGKPAALAMVYRICDGNFKSSAQELKKVNAPKNTKIVAAGKESTCENIYKKSETEGNIYLVKDGECIQSFSGGKFAAKIGKDDKTGDVTQEWTLKYTSLQKCAANTAKKYEITMKGVCKKDLTTPTFTTGTYGDCEAEFIYTGKGACYEKYIPMEKYMKQLAPFTGAILIVVGIIMTFFGSRFMQFMIAFLVCFGVTCALSLVGYNFLNSEKAQMWHLILLLVLALAFGILAGYFAWQFAKNWATTILAFWLGIMATLMILKLAKVSNQNITLIAAGVGGVIGAYIGSKYNRGIKQFGTAIIGSFILIRGVSTYIGNFPSEFSEDEATKKLLNPDNGTVLYYTLGYLVAFIVLALVGAWFQRRKLPPEDEDQKNDMMDGEDEAKVCGCF